MNTQAEQKIRKLLALANGDANENECATALRQAEALMRKHGIDEATVTMAAIDAGSLDTSKQTLDLQYGRLMPSWAGVLSVGVAKFTDTIVRISTVDGRAHVVFAGVTTDVATAAWLLRYLMEAVDRERKADKVGHGVAAYRSAAAVTLQNRMYALRRERDEVFKENTGFALVVVNTKLAKVKELYGEQRTAKVKSKASDLVSHLKGRSAGGRININTAIGSQRSLT